MSSVTCICHCLKSFPIQSYSGPNGLSEWIQSYSGPNGLLFGTLFQECVMKFLPFSTAESDIKEHSDSLTLFIGISEYPFCT